MKARGTKSFWEHYWALPPEIRQRARQAYKRWRDNPTHSSLFFKRVKENQPFYSVRIGLGYGMSGNFLFNADHSDTTEHERRVTAKLGATTLVRTRPELARIVAQDPFGSSILFLMRASIAARMAGNASQGRTRW